MRTLSQSVDEVSQEMSAPPCPLRCGTPGCKAVAAYGGWCCPEALKAAALQNPECICDACGKRDESVRISDWYECRSCEDKRDSDEEAERAWQASLSDYYGGSSPQTLDEQCAAAWTQKHGGGSR